VTNACTVVVAASCTQQLKYGKITAIYNSTVHMFKRTGQKSFVLLTFSTVLLVREGNRLKIRDKFSFRELFSHSRAEFIIPLSFYMTFLFEPLGGIKSKPDTSEYRNKI
jgi:hypothetical protein